MNTMCPNDKGNKVINTDNEIKIDILLKSLIYTCKMSYRYNRFLYPISNTLLYWYYAEEAVLMAFSRAVSYPDAQLLH